MVKSGSRPTPNEIDHELQSWDVDITDNFDLIFETPLPLPEYDSGGDLPGAASYRGSVATVDDGAGNRHLYLSNGANWTLIHGRGDTFPTTPAPQEGDKFYREDLDCAFYYDGTRSKWLSEAIFMLAGADTVNITGGVPPNGYMKMPDLLGVAFTSIVGWIVPFDVTCVGLTIVCTPSTLTLVARDNGSNITNATISLAAASSANDFTLDCPTVSQGNSVSLAIDSGTMNAPGSAYGYFRRVEA